MKCVPVLVFLNVNKFKLDDVHLHLKLFYFPTGLRNSATGILPITIYAQANLTATVATDCLAACVISVPVLAGVTKIAHQRGL